MRTKGDTQRNVRKKKKRTSLLVTREILFSTRQYLDRKLEARPKTKELLTLIPKDCD